MRRGRSVTIAVTAMFMLAGCAGNPAATGSRSAAAGTTASAPASEPASEPGSPPEESSSPAGGGGGEGAVTIADFAFDPATLEVSVGDTVTWTNEDSPAHTVTFADGPDSGSLSSGATFEHTFDAAGSFSYMCMIHPTMTATIEVTE